MTSSHTIRQMIIDENIPKLVKSLTGFNENDENFKLCETYAFSRVASHRFLSVNSHEVRRRIDGVAERFMADNYTQYGERLKHLVQEFVNDPLCTNHYEYDIQWSLLQFLLDVSRNPVAALSENKNAIKMDDSGNDEDLDRRRSSAMRDLVRSLIKQDDTKQYQSKDGESDLSDWSDDEDEGAVGDASANTSNDSLRTDVKPLRLTLQPFARDILRPPEKRSIFTEFDASKSEAWRIKNVQNPWWQSEAPANSTSVLSEWCLQREIIWMLQMQPLDDIDVERLKKFSKFFTLDTTTDEFSVNTNVTLNSTSVDGLQQILTTFALVSTKLYRFRKFFKIVFEPPVVNSFLESAQTAPHTIQNYATGLKDFLRIVNEAIFDLEAQLIEQDLTETHTIIYLHNQLLLHFRKVHILYDIHMKVYIDFKINEGHVCATHLFAGLIHEMDTTSAVERLNIAASLFLISIRFYLHVFNRWWIEGQFKDWCSEFLIQKCKNRLPYSSSNIYQRRSISAGISRSLDAAAIKNRIVTCEIVSLFCEESLEAGYILNILYNLNKLSEMKGQQVNQETQDIEEVFMNNFWEEVNKFHIEEGNESDGIDTQGEEVTEQIDSAASISMTLDETEGNSLLSTELLGDMDALLSMAFEQYAANTTTQHESAVDINEEPNNCYKLYEKISKITDFPMPLSVIIHGCLKQIFRSRISIANKYVLRIFLDEYKVLDHLINLQRVFFFGAGDLMLTFYSKLFKSMNAGEDWNNSYLLTVRLDDVLSSRYPEIHSMFSVQITATDSHIKETLSAIADITINYLVRDSVRDVIHDRALTKYNEIFRFLLQIKWAIWTLETMKFPVAFKKRPPYQELTLIDLIFKRLALVRNWIMYSVQCIHSHLMTFVIQSMGQQLVKRMAKVECIREIIDLHDSYIDTIYQHCFRKTSDSALRKSLEQLLKLVVVLRDEWNNLENVNSHGDFIDGENQFDVSATVQQVDIIEATYIDCHCLIAEVLTRVVYKEEQTTLASLSAAFNCSCPY
ncbi:gamma-tubulin complex component 5-like isoform X2 [Contarinia nasturtii]|uniref:gamma-tubulin complex component 5-like isoform X2 n=1 Tax=Contarinia nasturtii TaxID=265458 RepID=UPI0012D4AC74|nr:gamma-tubulin complex component 5-like isoform X2 [Contarinia nasturtii]